MANNSSRTGRGVPSRLDWNASQELIRRSLDAALAEQQAGLSSEDQRFVQALAYGVLRDWRLLQWLVKQMLQRPPRKSAALLETLLCVGLFQLRSMNQPPRAVVHSSVEAARELRMDWASGLVNAVLRRYQREREALEAAIPNEPGVRYSQPQWLLRALTQDWPDQLDELLAASNESGPMWLRINRQRQSPAEYLSVLQAQGIAAQASSSAPDAIRLEQPMPVTDLPGFADGLVSVQDAAAQLAAPLLLDGATAAGLRVLDACAAPGGKTGHLLEIQPDIELLALDSDKQRLSRVDENLARLKLQGMTATADAQAVTSWWDGRPFDRILLDAPCSGTGVIRRHPDIKWLRRATDIPAMAERQLELLQALWTTLAPGGRLLYATCSVLTAEGDDVIKAFLQQQGDAELEVLQAGWGQASEQGHRIATGQDDMDGFYYCLLTKRLRDVA